VSASGFPDLFLMSGIFLLKPRRLSLTVDHSIGHDRCHQVISIPLLEAASISILGSSGEISRFGFIIESHLFSVWKTLTERYRKQCNV
jgi:hypothetical protein